MYPNFQKRLIATRLRALCRLSRAGGSQARFAIGAKNQLIWGPEPIEADGSADSPPHTRPSIPRPLPASPSSPTPPARCCLICYDLLLSSPARLPL